MMNDPSENVQTLTEELASLKRRIRELEQAESKRREAEEALRESELKFRTIFDKASDGILITDVITKSFLQEKQCHLRHAGVYERRNRKAYPP